MNLLTEYIRRFMMSGWVLPLSEHPKFLVTIFIALVIARWLWSKGDKSIWGEAEENETIC